MNHPTNAPSRTVDGLKSSFPGDPYTLLIDIARNVKTPVAALEILARREFTTPPPDPKSFMPPRSDDDVVKSVAINPSLPAELIAILLQDPCEDARRLLIRHPNLMPELEQRLAQDSSPTVRQALAASTSVSQEALAALAVDSDTDVRRTLAANVNTPVSSLSRLATDTDTLVRSTVAKNQSTPVTVLAALALDEKVEVRRAIASNQNAPDAVRQELSDLVATPPPADLTPTLRDLPFLPDMQTGDLLETLSAYARCDNAFVRLTVLLHPLIADSILEEKAASPAWLERYAVAENIKTSSALLENLAQDSNWIVRCAAIQRAEGNAL